MSSLLFAIAIETLSKMISTLVHHDFMLGLLVGDPNIGTLYVSQLDDTHLFCEVDQNQIKALKALLLYFEAASSLKVNFDKSKLVSVGNVRNARQLANILG